MSTASATEPRSPARSLRRAWLARVLLVLAVSALALGGLSLLASRNLATLNADASWVVHTERVRFQLGRVLLLLTDIESAERGYALTQDAHFLEPYAAAAPRLEGEMRTLQQLISDNAGQRLRAAPLPALARERIAQADQVIERARAGDLDGARGLVAGGAGQRVMESARAVVAQMLAEEERLFVLRRAEDERARHRMALALWGTAGLALLLLALSAFTTMRDGARLFRAEEALATTLRSVGDGVISTDETGVVQFMNVVAERLTGWTERAALGQSLERVFRIVNEDSRETVASPAARVLREGRIVGLANHTVLLARDGSERPIEDSGAPIIGERGAIEGVVLVFRDATQERAARRALEASREQFVALAEAMPQLVWVTDSEGRYEYVNRNWAAYTGLDLEEAREERVWEILHPEDLERTRECWARSVKTGEPYEIEYRLRRHDGSYRWFLARASADRGPQGEIRRWFGTCTDIDATKRTEENLRATEAALLEADVHKDVFLATLSHELRNPLAPIRSAARLLESPRLGVKELERARSIISRQVRHMATLLDDLLDVSRITRGVLVLKKEHVELPAVLDAAIETARPLIEAKQHRLTLECPPDPLALEADPVRLTQIIANLLTNAAKYTEPGGQITLGARLEGQQLIIFVRDTGIGLAPTMLARVFEMFTQAQPDLERSEGGLGIGLALVKGLAELHGGSVEARSAGLARGSEFSVFLPGALVLAGSTRAIPTAPRDAAAMPSRPRRVLIADDNRDGAESLALILQLAGHEVYVAYSGPEAVALAAQQRPEVVVLDIGMPGLNGYEVAKRIRREAWGTHARLIAVTGWGRDADAQLAHASGFDYHLTKPVDPADLERLLS